jgi:serine/threonine protein phosphatase PrpC
MSEIKFTMAARCEAAGRPNNEDNFQMANDLSGGRWEFITGNKVTLNEKGALMVVCDGMGGMKAGATASALAVGTIKEWFAADRLTSEVMTSHATILQHIQQAISAADDAIKEAGQQNSEIKGMGSTIVLAWIVENNVFIGWCGDSRAYRYNAASGLERLSRDHSYVQELVDSGKLSEDLAFEHPDSNIITRSLGDTRQQIQPDVNSFSLNNGDMILLCSDGLSGVLRDTEIESVLANHSDTIGNCRDALWAESEKAGWVDNVTITLCRIESGIESPEKTAGEPEALVITTQANKRKPNRLLIILFILLLSAIAFELIHFFMKGCWWLPDFQLLILNSQPSTLN